MKKTLLIISIVALMVFLFIPSVVPLYGAMQPVDGGGGSCLNSASASIDCGVPPYVRHASCSVTCCGKAEAYGGLRCVYCYCNDRLVSQACC